MFGLVLFHCNWEIFGNVINRAWVWVYVFVLGKHVDKGMIGIVGGGFYCAYIGYAIWVDVG